MDRKSTPEKKPRKAVPVDTKEFRYLIDSIKFRFKNFRKELKRRMNMDPRWKI